MSDKKVENIENSVLEISDEENSEQFFRDEIQRCQQKLADLSADGNQLEKADTKLELANALLGLKQNIEAWNEAREAFSIFIENELWSQAVEACDILYQTEQPASIAALAHGVWLSVTYPVDPEHSIVMLNYIIDETPANSDGAAVAAATAHYIVGLRCNDENHDSLNFLTTNMIAKVAQRHSDVKTQDALNFWMDKLELKDPAVFLPRMGMVLNAIVEEGEWWFDRDALREKLPVN